VQQSRGRESRSLLRPPFSAHHKKKLLWESNSLCVWEHFHLRLNLKLSHISANPFFFFKTTLGTMLFSASLNTSQMGKFMGISPLRQPFSCQSFPDAEIRTEFRVLLFCPSQRNQNFVISGKISFCSPIALKTACERARRSTGRASSKMPQLEGGKVWSVISLMRSWLPRINPHLNDLGRALQFWLWLPKFIFRFRRSTHTICEMVYRKMIRKWEPSDPIGNLRVLAVVNQSANTTN
jgi:hypothetical protein